MFDELIKVNIDQLNMFIQCIPHNLLKQFFQSVDITSLPRETKKMIVHHKLPGCEKIEGEFEELTASRNKAYDNSFNKIFNQHCCHHNRLEIAYIEYYTKRGEPEGVLQEDEFGYIPLASIPENSIGIYVAFCDSYLNEEYVEKTGGLEALKTALANLGYTPIEAEFPNPNLPEFQLTLGEFKRSVSIISQL